MKFYFLLIALLLVSNILSIAQPKMNQLPVQLYSGNNDGFVIIGHRGASAYHPENTISAFQAAYNMGAEMVELDILLSKDGIPVVIHDDSLNRTTNAKGNVSEFTVEELQNFDAGSWFNKTHYGEKIPTLQEVLEFAKGKISLNIEIKTEAVTDNIEGGIEEKALELVKKYGMENNVIFSSFDYRALSHLRELDVDIYIALLYDKNQSNGRTLTQLVKDYDVNAFNCSRRQFSKKWAEEAKKNDISVIVYTINKKRHMKKMLKRGVSGIFSDKPDLLKQVVDNMWKTK